MRCLINSERALGALCWKSTVLLARGVSLELYKCVFSELVQLHCTGSCCSMKSCRKLLLCSTGSQLSMSCPSGGYHCTQIIQMGDEECPEQLSPDQSQIFPSCPPERGLEISLGSIMETVLHHSHCKSKTVLTFQWFFQTVFSAPKASAVPVMSLISRSCMVGVQSTASTGAS